MSSLSQLCCSSERVELLSYFFLNAKEFFFRQNNKQLISNHEYKCLVNEVDITLKQLQAYELKNSFILRTEKDKSVSQVDAEDVVPKFGDTDCPNITKTQLFWTTTLARQLSIHLVLTQKVS